MFYDMSGKGLVNELVETCVSEPSVQNRKEMPIIKNFVVVTRVKGEVSWKLDIISKPKNLLSDKRNKKNNWLVLL